MKNSLKKLNRFSNTSSKTTIFLLILFTLIYIVCIWVFYKSYKEEFINNRVLTYNLYVSNFVNKIDKIILNRKVDEIKKEIDNIIDSSYFSLIKIANNRYIFDKNTLIDNSKNFNDKSWSLGEVVVDIRYGSIKRLPNSNLYEFIATKSYNTSTPIKIRYQVYKDSQIKNVIAQIDFSKIPEYRKITYEGDDSFNEPLYDLKKLNKTYEIKKDGYLVSSISLNIDLYQIDQILQKFLFKLILFCFFMYLPLVFVLGFYHKYLFKKYVIKPVHYLNDYLDDMLVDKFYVLDKNNFEGTKEIKQLTKKIAKISTKIASLRNELNINKESLHLNSSKDVLTGLPNKTVFDFDIKSMYVSSVAGYVFILKIEKLSQISESHDTSYVNSFIQSYVNIINNVIKEYPNDIKLYRFYGSKFMMVAKNIDLETSKMLCERLIYQLHEKLVSIYDIPDDLIQIGGTFFDIYGTMDSLLNATDKAYENSKMEGINSYYIITEEQIERNYSDLDNNVVEIIQRADFQLNFVFDTYSFDKRNELIMTEASPLLYNINGKKISIGSFISIADKLKIAQNFDKLVIVKTIAYIRANNISHMISINLTMSSIKNKKFMEWLVDILLANKDIIDKIVFSFTSYSAYLNKKSFLNFINEIHKVNAKIILKRYKITEYPLKELEDLNLDFLRMSHEYTENFTNNLVKKHTVKNILIFAQLHNIKVIADSVKLDSDYDLLERLGTYGNIK